jgi:2-iminobutanoate/2-iminopropanoate deaminase
MQRVIINTEKAPAAIGPYVQANCIGGHLLLTSGQIPLDPVSGEVVGANISEQTAQALENLKAVLEEGGSSLDNVVKTTVFLTDMANFAAMNEVYSSYFNGAALPSRSAIAVLALPKAVLVEVEAIAIVTDQNGSAAAVGE